MRCTSIHKHRGEGGEARLKGPAWRRWFVDIGVLMDRHRSGPLTTLSAVVLAGAAWHVGPAAIWLSPVRRLLPALAGKG
jgi:hypothetical protein